MNQKPVKETTADKMVGRIVNNSNVTVDQAKKIVRESAERINRERDRKR